MARKHIVVCAECGKQFDANRGGYYNKQTRRYTCKSCGKKITGDARERSTGMRQSTGAMIAKIVFGALFVISGFTTGIPAMGENFASGFGALLMSIILGGALLAWGLVPYFKAKKAQEAAAARSMAVEIARQNAPKKCPACGAMTKGDVCEFCGSALK